MADARKKSGYWAELLAAGALGIFAGWAWRGRKDARVAAASATPPVTPELQTTAFPTSVDVTVAPKQNVAMAVAVGAIVIVWLPIGGRWVSVDGAGITDPVTPQAFDFAGPITHTYVWMDVASKTTNTSVIAFVVAPPAGNITT